MTMDQPATVFVVDDDQAILKSVTRLLRLSGLTVVGFGSPAAFLEAMPAGPGCVLLDQSMPELSGLEIQEKLAALDKSLQVVFVTGHGNVPTSVQAMKAGAFDFLEKPVNDEQLLEVVGRAIDHSARQQSEERERIEFLSRLSRLTPRERQVCDQVVQGQLNKQIAYDLGLSEKTVKVHRARFMRKLAVNSVAELARLIERSSGGTHTPRR
jgi:FixJ family two-component response regulator